MNIFKIIIMFFRAPFFHLPEDKTIPILLIGAGTGIAPFRSFWLERKSEKTRLPRPTGINGNGWGDIILFFGCRNSQNDDLYSDEIKPLVKSNIINQYHVAYSREPNKPKVRRKIYFIKIY